MTKQIGLVWMALGLLVIFADTSNAQYGIIQRSNRALGHWNGPGYHRCNPGPDSSYYNAWSQKNSFLISRSPQYLSRYGHEAFPSPAELLRTGQSAYGQPPAMANQGLHPSAVPINADFVPYQKSDREMEKTDEDRDSKSDDAEFKVDDFEPANDDIEDRFNAEVDDMEEMGGDNGFTEPRESDSSDQQSSPSDSADENESALLTPGSLFLPASHSGK